MYLSRCSAGILAMGLGVLVHVVSVSGQSALEKENLKSLGKAFMVYSRLVHNYDPVKPQHGPYEIMRSDFDGQGNVTTTMLEPAAGIGYVSLNRAGNLVAYAKGIYDTSDSSAPRVKHIDIWVMNIDGSGKRMIGKRTFPYGSNLSFTKTEDKVTFTSDTKTGRSYASMTCKLWMLGLGGDERLLLDLGSPTSSKYMGDTHVYESLVTYRLAPKVYTGTLPADTTRKTAQNVVDFGQSCEQDLSFDGRYMCTNNLSHTGIAVHRREAGGTWTKNIKSLSLMPWKTQEYRWTNDTAWLIANPEYYNSSPQAIYIVNWVTGTKIRVGFEDISNLENAVDGEPEIGEFRFGGIPSVSTLNRTPRPVLNIATDRNLTGHEIIRCIDMRGRRRSAGSSARAYVPLIIDRHRASPAGIVMRDPRKANPAGREW